MRTLLEDVTKNIRKRRKLGNSDILQLKKLDGKYNDYLTARDNSARKHNLKSLNNLNNSTFGNSVSSASLNGIAYADNVYEVYPLAMKAVIDYKLGDSKRGKKNLLKIKKVMGRFDPAIKDSSLDEFIDDIESNSGMSKDFISRMNNNKIPKI